MASPYRFVRFAVALALALPGSIATAELRNVEILFDPEVPTWREEVTVTIRGESHCLVTGVQPTADVLGYLLDVQETCPPTPAPFQPFEVSASLGQVSPQTHMLRVPYPGFPSVVVAQRELLVYRVADLVITPPAAPPTDGEPLRLIVSGYSGGCDPIELAEVEGQVIRAEFPDDCGVLPGLGIQEHEIEVGPLPAGDYEVRVFRDLIRELGRFREVKKASVRVYDEDGCVPSSTAQCLNDDRFRVEVAWKDFFGGSGAGQAVPFRDDTGLFWFFDPANVELTVKVLAACPVDGHHWVFVSSGSTVEYTLTVTDTSTGSSRTYGNALGEVPELIADTAAFPCL